MQRPTGVVIISVLAATSGVLVLLAGLLFLGSASAAGPFGGVVFAFGLITIALSVVQLVIAYGAWTMKPRARTAGVAVSVISIVLALLLEAIFAFPIPAVIIYIVLWGAIVYYLYTPGVKAAFGRT